MGKLFAFRSLATAEHFCRNVLEPDTYEIWEAEAEGTRRGDFMHLILHLAKRELLKFWRNPDAAFTGLHAPRGTVLCDAIKLVRRIAVVRRSA